MIKSNLIVYYTEISIEVWRGGKRERHQVGGEEDKERDKGGR